MNRTVSIFAIVALLAAVGLRGQNVTHGDNSPAVSGSGNLVTVQSQPTICGLEDPNYSKIVSFVQVSCKDYDALRAQLPGIPWPSGQFTEVLIHATSGTHVYVSIDGGQNYQRSPLRKDAFGRLIALVPFRGVEHTRIEVRAVTEEQ